MSTTKTKEELTRLAWITELRRQGHRQCTQAFRIPASNRVCALALLAEVAGLSLHDICMPDLENASGMTHDQTSEIIIRNDGDYPYGKHTFAEIADVVEGWFK